MKLLAIDPAAGRRKDASQTGWALFETEGRQLLEYGALSWEQVAKKDTRIRLLNRCDLLVIERQYQGLNAKVTEMLIEAKCKWTVVAADEGIKTNEVRPTEWQSKIAPAWKRSQKRDQLAVGVRVYVMSRYRLPGDLSQDAISAIGIGSYVVDMIAMGRLKV